jgi:nicotinamide-nucleotide amidase
MLHNLTLVKFLQSKKLTLALAESMTCGLAAHTLSTVQGTSDVLMGSVVCYHEDAKKCMLGVSKQILKKHTAESQQTTDAMVKKLSRLMPADIHAAITGLASPGGSETKRKPVGTVFFSVKYKKKIHRIRKKFNGSPLEIRKKACDFLYSEIMDIVK